ncbi:DUF2927 domain-containing protein [Crocinitomicaceae bacterium]|nr:DUF2927 domain-containing protein [Crocinitomicaceae bacterium]
MKTLLKYRILKFSFTCVASIAFYLGLPNEQRDKMKLYVKKEFLAFFNINPSEPDALPNDLFLPDMSQVDEETTYYFNQILRYSENRPNTQGPIFKWNKDIYMHLYGNYNIENKSEVMTVIKELNRLISPRRIHLVKNAKRANSFIYFGSITDYNKHSKSGLKLDGKYYGHFNILAHKQEIQRAYIFINTHDSGRKRQKHVIREEITQSLGFINDTYDYPESIFYQGYSEKTYFSEMDKKIISLLYQ